MASAAPSTSKNQIRRDVKEVHAARMDLPVRRSAKQRRQDRILRLKEYVGWLVMLPLCMLSLMAFMELLLKASLRGGLLTSGECQWFAIGAIIWLGMFVTARRWFVILYVFAHEMTHLFTARLFRAKIYGWHVGWDGGWVDTNKSNTFISLSPYVVPFYTVAVLLAFGVAGLFTDLHQIHSMHLGALEVPVNACKIMHYLVGFTWSFHLSFTLVVMREEQGDLVRNGQFFSVWLIALLNLYLIICFLITASPSVTWVDVYTCVNARFSAILSGGWQGIAWGAGRAWHECGSMLTQVQNWKPTP